MAPRVEQRERPNMNLKVMAISPLFYSEFGLPTLWTQKNTQHKSYRRKTEKFHLLFLSGCFRRGEAKLAVNEDGPNSRKFAAKNGKSTTGQCLEMPWRGAKSSFCRQKTKRGEIPFTPPGWCFVGPSREGSTREMTKTKTYIIVGKYSISIRVFGRATEMSKSEQSGEETEERKMKWNLAVISSVKHERKSWKCYENWPFVLSAFLFFPSRSLTHHPLLLFICELLDRDVQSFSISLLLLIIRPLSDNDHPPTSSTQTIFILSSSAVIANQHRLTRLSRSYWRAGKSRSQIVRRLSISVLFN